MFAQGTGNSSYVRINFNDQCVFDEYLMSTRGGYYSLSLAKCPSGEGFKIPIDPDLLKAENLVNITVGDHTSWNITSVSIIVTYSAYDVEPFWKTLPHYNRLFSIVLAAEIIVTIIIADKSRKWIGQQ